MPLLFFFIILCPIKDGPEVLGGEKSPLLLLLLTRHSFMTYILIRVPQTNQDMGFKWKNNVKKEVKLVYLHFSTHCQRVQTLPFDAINYPLYSSIPGP